MLASIWVWEWIYLQTKICCLFGYLLRLVRTLSCVPQTGISFGENHLSKKMYVGNLSFETTEEQVRDLFTPYGAVESINMIHDRMSGQFRGFCFVEMETSAANAAMKALDSKELSGRTLKVNEAKPREERSDGQRSSFRGGDNQRGGYGRSR